jgi:hypothetical protein
MVANKPRKSGANKLLHPAMNALGAVSNTPYAEDKSLSAKLCVAPFDGERRENGVPPAEHGNQSPIMWPKCPFR